MALVLHPVDMTILVDEWECFLVSPFQSRSILASFTCFHGIHHCWLRLSEVKRSSVFVRGGWKKGGPLLEKRSPRLPFVPVLHVRALGGVDLWLLTRAAVVRILWLRGEVARFESVQKDRKNTNMLAQGNRGEGGCFGFFSHGDLQCVLICTGSGMHFGHARTSLRHMSLGALQSL